MPQKPGTVAVKRQEQLGVSSSQEHKSFHKASRQGCSRAAPWPGAERARCRLAQAREEEQNSSTTTTGSTRHADRSINSSMSASRSAR